MSDSPAMISAPKLCPKCGAEIPADAPEGGCPGCLLQNGLDLLPDARDASTVISTKADQGGSAEKSGANSAAAAAGHSEKAAHSAETLGELGDYELLEVGRSGRGLPGSSEKSQSHRGAQSDWLGPLDHRLRERTDHVSKPSGHFTCQQQSARGGGRGFKANCTTPGVIVALESKANEHAVST